MKKTTAPPPKPAGDSVQRLVCRLKSKAKREWQTIWRKYPHHKRTPEERQIVNEEQIRINGYIQALNEVLANIFAQPPE